MRKIFLSTVILNPVNLNNPVTHKSRDLDLGDKQFIFPISYLLDTNLSKGDNALILTGMSQTEIPKKNYELLKAKMDKLGLTEGLEWYLDTRKYGGCVHSGFGIGFDRLLMYVTGMQNIRDVQPYPRTSNAIKY